MGTTQAGKSPKLEDAVIGVRLTLLKIRTKPERGFETREFHSAPRGIRPTFAEAASRGQESGLMKA